jgi:hypothetical protein
MEEKKYVDEGYESQRGKRPLRKPRCRWVDNIKMNLVDRMEWCGLDWSHSG